MRPISGSPNRLHLIVPYNAGGVTDAVTRLLGQKLAESWNVPVPVANRPGASGMLGTNPVSGEMFKIAGKIDIVCTYRTKGQVRR
jgi:tripartite-type tricarboxylate transporter receptor subunit TctC